MNQIPPIEIIDRRTVLNWSQVEGSGLVIDKPLGLTSHDVVARVRRRSAIKRVGHSGTLDPLATGVLIILVGRSATKHQQWFMDLPKIYQAEITFGATSTTDDAEGVLTQVTESQQLQLLTASQVAAVLPRFIGTILQRPPIYAAIKSGGQPLYKRARAGTITAEEVPVRTVTIDSITMDHWQPADDDHPWPRCQITVTCHKGTYIRSLVRDIGQAVGTGAYMSGLVRLQLGDYHQRSAFQLSDIIQTL